MYAVIDFETRSPADIRVFAATNYSKHPETEILCVSVWDSGFESVRTWRIDPFEEPPDWFVELHRSVKTWVAHNAYFEISMWRNVLSKWYPQLPCPELSKWQDTRALVLSWALPASLEKASAVLGDEKKDTAGHKLMMKMCKPRRPSKNNPARYWWSQKDFDRLVEYCEQDVLTTLSILKELGPIQRVERSVFELDKQINHRGFAVDLELARAAYEMAEQLNREAERELSEITGGFITTPNQHTRFKQYAASNGVQMSSTNIAAVVALLAREVVPDHVRRVFEIRQALGKSSVAKYKKCLNLADPETGRIYDAFVFHKAGPGRWAGQGFQPQNLPRGELSLNDGLINLTANSVKSGDLETIAGVGNPLYVLSDLVRSTIIAPRGKKFVAADFASVEARGALWLAGETDAVEMLRNGGDIYKDMASTIFSVSVKDVTKDQRFVGKTAILGLGYGMGHKKFAVQARIDIDLAKLSVDTYRSKFSGIPNLWRILEKAMRDCIMTRQPTTAAGFVFYMKKPRVLAIRLLSGREIHYWDPTYTRQDGIQYWTVSGTSGKWIQTNTWGGKILENVDQGICSCLLRNSMRRLDAAHWPIVMSVHDEVVCEVPDKPEYNPDKMCEIMTRLPKWAKGFPLAAEGWEGRRFRK